MVLELELRGERGGDDGVNDRRALEWQEGERGLPEILRLGPAHGLGERGGGRANDEPGHRRRRQRREGDDDDEHAPPLHVRALGRRWCP